MVPGIKPVYVVRDNDGCIDYEFLVILLFDDVVGCSHCEVPIGPFKSDCPLSSFLTELLRNGNKWKETYQYES